MSEVSSISAASFVLPPQMISEWRDDDYIASIRSICNNWNFNVYQYNLNAIAPKELGLPMGFADRCYWWSEYYFGRQQNIDFDGFLLRPDGKRRAVKMFRGKDVKKFVDDQVGMVQQSIKYFPDILNAFGVSENVISQKKTNLDIEKFLTDERVGRAIGEILKPYQMFLETMNGQKMMNTARQQASSMDYVESLESAAVNVGKDFLYRNMWEEQMTDLAKDAYICGLSAAKVSVCNGYPLLERFPAYEAIVPPRNNGDQHRNDAFGGRIRFMTVAEIRAMYPELSEATLKEIENIAYTRDQAIWNDWNVTSNMGSSIVWWSVGPADGVPRVGVADVQWASYAGKEGEEYKQSNRQGILIGNKYLIRQGLVTNQNKYWCNPTHTNFDFMFVRPMSVFGSNMGIPEVIYTYVNQIDAWQTRINDWIAKAKGNQYVLYAKKLPEGVDSMTVISDLAEDGVVVFEGVDIDAGDTSGHTMENLSMELPNSVITLIGQIQQYRQMMADILNIPDQARGQIKGYQPTKNIEASVANSSKGTSTFTMPLNTYFLRIIQKGIDKFITATLDNKDIEYDLIVGDTQMIQLKKPKDLSISRFGSYLHFDDLMDDQKRTQIEGTIFAYAQNSQQTGYTLGDLFAIQTMNTKSEIDSYLEFRDMQIKQERQQQMDAEMQANAANTERMAQSNEQQTAMREEGQNTRASATIMADHNTKENEMLHERVMAGGQQMQ